MSEQQAINVLLLTAKQQWNMFLRKTLADANSEFTVHWEQQLSAGLGLYRNRIDVILLDLSIENSHSVDTLTQWMARGMRFIVYSTDLGFLLQGARNGLEALRQAAQG